MAAPARAALRTQNPNYLRIVYRAQLDENMKVCLYIKGCLNPCSGLFCAARRVYENSYVQIHENRVEVNVPSMFTCCICLPCCDEVNDYVQVYYFDKRIAREAHRTECCSPVCCFPCGINPYCGGYIPPALYFRHPCFPTCCDICGQGVTLHGRLPMCCCHQFAQIPFLQDADGFVNAFQQAKVAYNNGGAPATSYPAGGASVPVGAPAAYPAGAPPAGAPAAYPAGAPAAYPAGAPAAYPAGQPIDPNTGYPAGAPAAYPAGAPAVQQMA